MKSKNLPAASSTPTGSEPILPALKRLGLPLTRENYLALAYPSGLPEEWTQELENELPKEIRHDYWRDDPIIDEIIRRPGLLTAALMREPRTIVTALMGQPQLHARILRLIKGPKRGRGNQPHPESLRMLVRLLNKIALSKKGWDKNEARYRQIAEDISNPEYIFNASFGTVAWGAVRTILEGHPKRKR